MRRILGLAAVTVLCAACRSPAPVYDPFLGRTTVEPPGTALPPPGQPYYGAPAGAPVTAPIVTPAPGTYPAVPRVIGPSSFAPAPAGQGGLSSSFAPNVSPVSPNGLPTAAPGGFNQPPITPVSSKNRPIYGPPGGLAYPQAYATPAGGTPTLAQSGTPKPLDVDRFVGPANGSANGLTNGSATPQSAAQASVVPVSHWDSTDGSSTSKSAVPAVFTSPAGQSAIRIVEPTANASATKTSAVSGSQFSQMAAAIPVGTSAGTLNQSLARARAPELSELPPARSAASSGSILPSAPAVPVQAAPVQNAAASSGISSIDSSRSSYGYDAQYRWLKGKLEYSQSTRIWRLRYIPPDGSTDSYGGSVILNDAAKLSGLNPGDFVVMQGTVGRSISDQNSFAPQYNLDRIQKQ